MDRLQSGVFRLATIVKKKRSGVPLSQHLKEGTWDEGGGGVLSIWPTRGEPIRGGGEGRKKEAVLVAIL